MGWEGTNPADWARRAQAQILAVKRGAVQELAKEMTTTIPNGGRVPVKTGNLARSLVMSTGTIPMTAKAGTVFASQDFGADLLNVELGETVYLGYQANSARRMNYGFVGTDSLGRNYNQAGHGFVEAAAAKWPSIVARVAADVREKMGS